jgi:proteasome lid subunit RPN8/RPN11
MNRPEYQKMIAQAKEAYPLECCGLLGGVKDGGDVYIQSVHPLYNLDQSSEHFSMDPKEQFEVVKGLRKQGKRLVGNYHSHPYTPSRPSQEDKKLAYDETMIYGIVSLEQQEPVLHFFSIKGQVDVEKLTLEIIEVEE